MKYLTKYRAYSWIFLLIPIYLFLFLKLGSAHIRLWDEGWFAVHAVEMLEKGSWFVSYFDGQPSYTSSKPPLQTWLQMGFISLLGINELALRLPSAMAAAGTVLGLYFFLKKHISTGTAFMASMILLTSIGFVGFHTARGAEADALLTLALMLQAWSVFEFTQSKNINWLYVTAASTAVGFWAKSVAAFLLLPGYAIYIFAFERAAFITLLKSPHFYISIAITILLVVLYVFIRNHHQPGYIDMFLRSNVGRYTESVGHDQHTLFYIRNFLDGRYNWWMPFVIIGLVLAFSRASANFPVVGFAATLAIAFLVVISLSKSKLVWYDMPVYPLAAVPAAFTLKQMLNVQAGIRKGLLIAVLFAFPSYHMFLNAQANRLSLQEMNYESQEIFLCQASRKNKNIDGLIVAHDHFNGSLLFYKHKLASEGSQINLTNTLEHVQVGDKLLLLDTHFKNDLLERFEVDTIDRLRDAIVYQINREISQTTTNEQLNIHKEP